MRHEALGSESKTKREKKRERDTKIFTSWQWCRKLTVKGFITWGLGGIIRVKKKIKAKHGRGVAK